MQCTVDENFNELVVNKDYIQLGWRYYCRLRICISVENFDQTHVLNAN